MRCIYGNIYIHKYVEQTQISRYNWDLITTLAPTRENQRKSAGPISSHARSRAALTGSGAQRAAHTWHLVQRTWDHVTFLSIVTWMRGEVAVVITWHSVSCRARRQPLYPGRGELFLEHCSTGLLKLPREISLWSVSGHVCPGEILHAGLPCLTCPVTKQLPARVYIKILIIKSQKFSCKVHQSENHYVGYWSIWK